MIENAYNRLVEKIELKYNTKKELEILKSIQKTVDMYLLREEYSEIQRDLLRYLYHLNQKKIFEIEAEIESIEDGFSAVKMNELKIIISLRESLQDVEVASYIKKLQSKGKKVYVINDNYEFVDGNNIKKIDFDKYYDINSYNYEAFYDLSWDIIYIPSRGSYYFLGNYTIVNKIPFSSFYKEEKYKSKFIQFGKNFFEENGIYYTLNFTNYYVIHDNYGFYAWDNIFASWWSEQKYFFYKSSNGAYWIIIDYQKIKLINASIINNIVNKEKFLSVIVDDKKYIHKETDAIFNSIKSTTQKVISWETDVSKKIEKIYAWIIENIDYSKEIDLNNPKIFSWIWIYNDKEWVCDGYAKLFMYMLLFAGFDDVELIKWFVIDVPDFPELGHSWVRIGDLYYDPTFDDPIGSEEPIPRKYYQYFALPQDLFYTNRYNTSDFPIYIKDLSVEKREEIVRRNISFAFERYKDNNYYLLAMSVIKYNHGISLEKTLIKEDLKKILPYYEVSKQGTFIEDGKTKIVDYIYYYTIDKNINIEDFFESFHYEIDDFHLFIRTTENNKVEYRIAKDFIKK